jgi:hypothetical protein
VDVYVTYCSVQDPMNRFSGILTIVDESLERHRLQKAERDQLFLASLLDSAEDAIILAPPGSREGLHEAPVTLCIIFDSPRTGTMCAARFHRSILR